MTVAVGYHWHLRRAMAEHGMFTTTELLPLLAERGVVLSREQVYRLAAKVPQRLSLHILAALCDILDCQPGDLIEPYRARASRPSKSRSQQRPRPRRARITDER